MEIKYSNIMKIRFFALFVIGLLFGTFTVNAQVNNSLSAKKPKVY